MLVRSLPLVGPGSFFVSSRTVVHRVFCWLFHWGQFLQKMLPGLDAILALLAGGVGAACGLGQVLFGQAVARLQLVEPGGEAPLPPWGPVFAFRRGGTCGCSASRTSFLPSSWSLPTSARRGRA